MLGGFKMNELYEKVRKKLSIIENMYDGIRIINPINKNIISIKNDEIKNLSGKCYESFDKGTLCSNCISMRAYIEKDTFIKMECISNKVMLIVATPVIINEEMYVVEMIKNISSQNNETSNVNYENNVSIMIDNINEKIIRDDLTGAYNKIYIEERLPVDIRNSSINEKLLSVIMIDIDDFENINDKCGQEIGIKILEDFSKIINDSVVKNSYWIARYSVDKFIVVLNDINKEESYKILENIRDLLEETSFEYNEEIIKLKSNLGIYCSENEIADIKSILVKLKKSIFEEKQKTIEEETNKKTKLSILNYRIQELRNVLNEMRISSDDKVEYKQTLKISQDLDELIVEYMKNII